LALNIACLAYLHKRTTVAIATRRVVKMKYWVMLIWVSLLGIKNVKARNGEELEGRIEYKMLHEE